MNHTLSVPSFTRCLAWLLTTCLLTATAQAADLKILFLGDNGHHQPQPRFHELQPLLAERGIEMTYTDAMADVNLENLKRYDALVLYANIDRIESPQEQALLQYVADGGGFVPLHCASFCFRNSEPVVKLMGAQFKSHGTGVFRTQIADAEHPVMRGFGGFESWDETYVHHLHNEANRTVLSYRVDAEGREPWTWVRTHGEGRVFYTAWGHDQRTWTNPGFANLVERGIRWAAGDDPGSVPDFGERAFPVPEMTALPTDVKPFEFIEVGNKIPNYTPSDRWGVQGDPLTKMQKPLPPEEAIKHLSVPKGFHVELFASEPEIGGKPICMAWDHRGRLWIAETYDYPNELQPEGKGRDRIRILEDTDGDWRADKFTVFADKLSIPTSITFYGDDVIVHDGKRTLVLTDTDGDDVADQRRELFTGWNQGDTHGGVSNFQYGLDNWIWAMQGYNQSTPKNPALSDQPESSFRNGFFRFRPDGSEIEFIRSTDNNTWGLGISEEGVIFGSTANRNPSVYMPIPNRYYERVRGWTASLRLGSIADTYLFKPITENIRQVDQHGGYTAAAGHALYTARTYPQAYWNRAAFVNGPTGHLVGTFVISPDGSDYRSTSPFNLLASDDQWSAPIMSEVGPDGNVWVIDWYNYIVQHNPTPQGFKTGKGNAYETDLRDKKYGRIYRVVYDEAPAAKPFSLADATTAELVQTLGHSNMLWRKHAQRLLVEQADESAVSALVALTQDSSTDAIGLNVGAIHALWTLHGLGQMADADAAGTQAALAALSHPSAGVRRNALQVLPADAKSTNAVLASGTVTDDHPQVRLAALLALSDLPPAPGAGSAILKALVAAQREGDRWLQDAAISAAATNADSFLPAVATSLDKPNPAILDAAAVVSGHYGRSGPVDSIARVIKGLSAADGQIAGSLLAGLAAGWPAGQQPAMTDAFETDLQTLMDKLPAGQQGVLVKLGTSWGSKRFDQYAAQVTNNLLKQIDNESAAPAQRLDAVNKLVQFRSQDSQIVAELLDRITPQVDPALALGIVRSVQLSEAADAGEQLLGRFDTLTPAARTAGIGVLLSRPSSTRSLLKSIETRGVLLSELSLDQKQALMSHPDRELRRSAERILASGGAMPDANRQQVLTRLMPTTQASGDAANGKLVFKKNCANCHMHSGEGKHVGPDLTGMAVHPKAELLTHILDPSRDVEGNYRVYTVLTADGLVVNGLLASESKTAIEMYDAKGEKQTILRDDIDEMQASRKSLMPEGFENQINATEMTDLLEFLTARGQFFPLDIGRVATLASDRGMFVSKTGDVERLIFPDWGPKVFNNVTFQLTDPKDGSVPNAIVLHSSQSPLVASLPKSITIPVNGNARAIHMLGGVSGWGFPYGTENSLSMTVRLKYTDGKAEDHPLLNGVHFADYIRRVDVPGSEFAFALRDQQIRYLVIHPQRAEAIESIELIKGEDRSAPVVMAITLEQ